MSIRLVVKDLAGKRLDSRALVVVRAEMPRAEVAGKLRTLANALEDKAVSLSPVEHCGQ